MTAASRGFLAMERLAWFLICTPSIAVHYGVVWCRISCRRFWRHFT